MNKIYLDSAATTPVDDDVLKAMLPYFSEHYANANSLHDFARKPEAAVSNARKQVADAIGCKPNEIYFTASGTEANNWAVKGAATARMNTGKHVIVSSIEHPSIINSANQLGAAGFDVTFLEVSEKGIISPETLEKALRNDTVLVSVMLANNEVGVIQNIKSLANIAKRRGAIVHSDCVQAVGALDFSVESLGVDMLTLSAHKFYGPKGVGALYIKNGLKIDRLIAGGGQERTMRGGTTNTPAVVGMGFAIEKAVRERRDYASHCLLLREHLIDRITNEIEGAYLNGDRTLRLPNNANFSFEFIEADSILTMLDLKGIAVSSGSACSSGSLEASHVLLAMNVPIELAHGSIRFSVGKHNTLKEIDTVVDELKLTVCRLREMSPLYSAKESVKKV